MDVRVIDFLLSQGYWFQVSPLAHGTGWACAVYKKGKKSGNWITEKCKTLDTPHEGFDWCYDEMHKMRGF